MTGDPYCAVTEELAKKRSYVHSTHSTPRKQRVGDGIVFPAGTQFSDKYNDPPKFKKILLKIIIATKFDETVLKLQNRVLKSTTERRKRNYDVMSSNSDTSMHTKS